jgi:hypothetical protein
MKRQTNSIFVDDGYPESMEYDTNYVEYDPADPVDCDAAMAEARRRLSGRMNRPGGLPLKRPESVSLPSSLPKLRSIWRWRALGTCTGVRGIQIKTYGGQSAPHTIR